MFESVELMFLRVAGRSSSDFAFRIAKQNRQLEHWWDGSCRHISSAHLPVEAQNLQVSASFSPSDPAFHIAKRPLFGDPRLTPVLPK
jgi:hypothetical protein